MSHSFKNCMQIFVIEWKDDVYRLIPEDYNGHTPQSNYKLNLCPITCFVIWWNYCNLYMYFWFISKILDNIHMKQNVHI